MKRLIIVSIISSFLVLTGFAAQSRQTVSALSQTLSPVSIITLKGSTGGQSVGDLAVMDQTGTQDDPTKYVTFTTGKTIYSGYRQYYLSTSVPARTISSMNVRVNYKGLGQKTQAWTWYLFNWSSNKWVAIGTNAAAQANAWSLLTFKVTTPARFVRSTGEIRILLTSSNAKGLAEVDYESVDITYILPHNTITLTVNTSFNRNPISPYIYGMNFAKPAFAQEIGLSVRRWGGNDTSRYNWQTGNSNSGSDWYFENSQYSDPFTGNFMTHLDWINQNISTGTDSLITIPMVGYVAKDNSSCGFNTSIFGAQQSVDPYLPSCGNGVKTNGQNVIGNNPSETSFAVDQNFMKSWVQDLAATYGTAAKGGVKFYDLDNEPELWNETHRDVHPAPQTYDELLSKTEAYGAVIKSADPSAQLFGYVSYGWTGYWYSESDVIAAAANGYTAFPDYSSHGDMYQTPWYLSQMNQYQKTNGTRLLDYLDLHYYPAENGVSLATAGSAATQALRLRSTRSLWDSTYQDESWIGGSDQPQDWQYVQLIPRMHNWVNSYYPGTKLSISEYNWGGLESINGALAQADVLGIFGREGLDMALLWNYPNSGDGLSYQNFDRLPGSYAFRMYRNYDASGGKFGDESVSAVSGDQSQLAIYAAQRSGDSALTLMIINKTSATLLGNILLNGFTSSGNAQVYLYSSANLNAIVRQADQSISSTGMVASFPASSITLMVIPGN